ncbi:MAG: bifunctional oligoribonuclease/PAP phosphatase NrnA [Candidatus Thorarchaeota archaeon]
MRVDIRALLSSAKNIIILGHHNADPDAVCSMIAFQHLVVSINPGVTTTLACDDVSRLSKQVLDTFAPASQILENADGEFDLVIVLDTNSSLQLGNGFGKFVSNPSVVLVVDHHEFNPEVHQIAEHTVIETQASSTCEVLVKLYREMETRIDPKIANLLLTGMLFDTRRFFYVGPATLESALALVKDGADYDACIRSLTIKPDRSERIARLKAASRLLVHTIGDWVIVTAKIGAYEASACRGLIDLGADVAIVGGKPAKDVVRISARSTNEFYQETGINLGTDIMEPLGELIDGKGGGHPNAAGANGTRNRKKALLQSVELIRKILEQNSSTQTQGG